MTVRASDILAVLSENEALKSELERLRSENHMWFDIALTRLGMVQSMAYEISMLKAPMPPAPTDSKDRT